MKNARTTGTGRPRARWGRFALRIVLRLAFAVVVALAVASAAVLGRLYLGPIESDTVARAAEQVASQALGAGRATNVGHAALELTAEHGIAIRLNDILAGSPEEGVTVTVPTAVIRLRALPLIIGRLQPWSLEIQGSTAHIDLTRLDAGNLIATLDAGRRAAVEAAKGGVQPAPLPVPVPAPTPPPASGKGAGTAASGGARPLQPDNIAGLGELGRMMANAVAHIRQEGLQSVYSRDGRVEVIIPNPETGTRRTLVVRELEVASVFGRGGVDADISIGARGSIGRWSTRLRQVTDEATGGRRTLFEAKDLTLPDLTGIDEPDFKFETPIYPYLMVETDKDDRVRVARLSLKFGAGKIRFGKEPEDEALVDEGEVDVAWDTDARRFLINRLAFEFGPTAIAFLGSVVPPSKPTDPWQIRLDLERGLFAPQDAPGKPVSLDNAFVQANFDVARRVLTVEDAQIHFAGAALAANGTLNFAAAPVLARFNIAASPIAAEPLKHAWPHWINAGGRRWFIENVLDGRVTGAQIRVAIPMGIDPPFWPKDAVFLDARFEGGVVKPLGDLPNIIGANGRLHLENKAFEASVDNAQVATRTAKPPTLASFKLTVADAIRKQARGVMELRGMGDAAAFAEIVNAEPLKVLDRAGVKPDGHQGTVEVRGRIETTFDDDPAVQNVVYRFEATTDKFGSTNPILGRKFSDGQLKIVVDKAGTTITGKAKIDGVATDVNMYEPADKAVQERRDFSLLIDDSARQRLGLDLEGLVAGPMKVEVGQGPAGDASKRITADLTGTRLMLSEFGWTKGQGVAAKASFDLIPDDKGTRLENFAVESEGLALQGKINLDDKGQFLGAELSRFALRKGDDGKIKVGRAGTNLLNVDFEASNFDIRSFVQSMRQAETKRLPNAKKPYDLNVKVRAARLVGFNDVVFSDAAIDAEVRGAVLTKLSMSARASGGRSVDISIKPTGQGGPRTLWVASDDAGAVVGFLGLFDRMIGGTINVRGTLDKPGNASGWMQVVGFRLANQDRGISPSEVAASDGTRELPVREARISDEAAFDRFGLGFEMKNGVIYVTDGIAKGAATGATASGQIDLNSQKINLAGTFIPLYGLNNTISRVPLIGEIFGGGRNEGLIGVTFQVVGKIDDPVLAFNPLSAIAPGIFRKIFEFRPDNRIAPPG